MLQTCRTCGFEVPSSRRLGSLYCSVRCGTRFRARIRRQRVSRKEDYIPKCQNCGQVINYSDINKIAGLKYCSASCKKQYRRNLDKEWRRNYKQTLKKEVFIAYGENCACCGENNFSFLSVDHINGNGKQHRLIVDGSNLYKWLKNNNYPRDNFQLLCFNCNWGKRRFNCCPHNTEQFNIIYTEKYKQWSNTNKYFQKLRQEIISSYGGICRCCAESVKEFLTIDHIFGDGKADVKSKGGSKSFFSWIKKNNFPTDRYQLLCFKCNFSKYLFTCCPHKLSMHSVYL